MSERITIPLKPSADTPSKLMLDFRVINKRHADNVGNLLRGNFGTALDIARIREAVEQFPLNEEQKEAIKQAARLTVASLAGQFANDNARSEREAKQRERAAKEREQQETSKVAARKAQAEQSVAHMLDNINQASDDKVLELAARIEAARKAKQESEGK